MAYKAKFGTRRRDYLWSAWRTRAYLDGRGNLPICPHCDEPVLEDGSSPSGSSGAAPWHECHVGVPRCFGGKQIRVGHADCNLRDGRNVTRVAAKAKRVRRLHLGITGPGLGRHPMPCGRRSSRRKSMGGKVVDRATHAQLHAAFMHRRYGVFQQEEPQS